MSLPTTSSLDTADYRELVGSFRETLDRIRTQVRRVIIGQDDVVEHLLITLLVGGHCLITGMPGTAKRDVPLAQEPTGLIEVLLRETSGDLGE